MATTCESSRASALRRAIASVLTQSTVAVELVVVVNGARYDPGLLAELRADARLTVLYLEEASFPAALRRGRQHLSGAFFAFLDDDDIYLPGALRTRFDAISADPPVDFVCTNGYVEADGVTRPFVDDEAAVQDDPLAANFHFNWLGSSAALFRSGSVGPEFFDGVTKHFEWTWLTYRLLVDNKQCRFVATPTFVKHDTPGSLSKDSSLDPLLTEQHLLRLMMEDAPSRLRGRIRGKMRATLHVLSDYHRRRGSLLHAWSCHLRSLTYRGGWRHLGYTRRVIASTLLRAFGARTTSTSL